MSSDFHLNVIMGDSRQTKQQEATALFEFALSHPNSTEVRTSSDIYKRNVSLHFICVCAYVWAFGDTS